MKIFTLLSIDFHTVVEWWEGIGLNGLLDELEMSKSDASCIKEVAKLNFYIRLLTHKRINASETFHPDDKLSGSTVAIEARKCGFHYWPPVTVLVKDL